MSNLGNKQIMASNIRSHLDTLGLNAKEFSNKLDFKYSTVLDWLNAKTYPRIDKIEKMANFFGIEKADLVEEKDSLHSIRSELLTSFDKLETTRQQKVVDFSSNQLKQQIYEKNHTAKILPINETSSDYDDKVYYTDDLLGAVSAGTGEWLDEVSPERVRLSTKPPRHDFSLRVNGNSMEPLFDDGQIIFINKIDEPSQVLSNQIVIAELNGEAYVKKIVLEGNSCRLVSLNKDYADILVKPSDEFYIRGVVVF